MYLFYTAPEDVSNKDISAREMYKTTMNTSWFSTTPLVFTGCPWDIVSCSISCTGYLLALLYGLWSIMMLFIKQPSHCSPSTLPLIFLWLHVLISHNKGEEEWGRKQENPRKEVNQLPRSKATLFCPVHVWSLYLEDSVLLDNVYSSQVPVPLCCTKNIRVLASCVLVGLGIQCEHPWCCHIMRLQGIQLHGTAATYLLSFPLLHSKHEGNAYEAGACSVESAVRMTQDYEVLQNACWKSIALLLFIPMWWRSWPW